jgi:hypothetical protein
MWILRVHECHRRPRRLYDLSVLVLDPHAGLACLPQIVRSIRVMQHVTYLVALAPPTVCPLLAHEKVACSTSRLTCLVCLAHERKTLQSEHCGVGKADTPRPHPTTFRSLNSVQKRYGTLYCFAVVGHNCVSMENAYAIVYMGLTQFPLPDSWGIAFGRWKEM